MDFCVSLFRTLEVLSSSAGILCDRSAIFHFPRRDSVVLSRIRCAHFGRVAVVIGKKAMKPLQSKRLRSTLCTSISAARGKWRCGFPGRLVATNLHELTDGMDTWARCPAHERRIWKPGRSRGSRSLCELCHRRLRASVPLHSSNSIVYS